MLLKNATAAIESLLKPDAPTLPLAQPKANLQPQYLSPVDSSSQLHPQQ